MFLGAGISNTWYNIDCCDENYRCDKDLYLLSILLKHFNKNIDRGISVPGHGREVVDGLNYT